MKRNLLIWLCVAALFVVAPCLTGVQLAYGQVSAIVLQSNGTSLRQARLHMLSGYQASTGYFGQSDDGCGPCGAQGAFAGGRGAWVNYLSRQNSLDFEQTEQDILNTPLKLNSNGIQFGTDLYRSKRNQFGLLFDYERFDTMYERHTDILQSDNYSGGFYYAHVFDNNADFRALMKFGGANHKAIGTREKVTSDSYNAIFEYGKRYYPVQNISFRPYAALDINYAYAQADTIGGYAYRNAKLTQNYIRIGTDMMAQIRRFTVVADISYSVDMVSNHLNVTTREGEGSWIDDRLKIGRQIASLGLTGQYDINRRQALFASYGLDAFFDRDSQPYQSTFTVGYSFVW